jgi:8-oxo-dGTP pyrophosphatase MutT (NUDIX family)
MNCDWFGPDSGEVAVDLLGKVLRRGAPAGRIVEVEACRGTDDPGRPAEMMLLDAGHDSLQPALDAAVARVVVAGCASSPHRDHILEIIDSRSDVLERTCRPGHLTGSALVLDAAGERTCLLLHRKLGRWLQPGGHADGDANMAAVALREATEETGIPGLRVDPVPVDLDVHEVDPPGEDAHLHLDVRFLVVAPPGTEPVGNHESTALGWFTPDEMAGLEPDVGMVRLLAAARERYTSSGT